MSRYSPQHRLEACHWLIFDSYFCSFKIINTLKMTAVCRKTPRVRLPLASAHHAAVWGYLQQSTNLNTSGICPCLLIIITMSWYWDSQSSYPPRPICISRSRENMTCHKRCSDLQYWWYAKAQQIDFIANRFYGVPTAVARCAVVTVGCCSDFEVWNAVQADQRHCGAFPQRRALICKQTVR